MSGPPARPGRRPLPPDLGRLLHDLRGPLNSLTMHLEVLKRTVRDDDPVAEDSLRTVLVQLGRLSAMLPAAFDVAALELGPLQPVDLGAVATAAQKDASGPITLADGRWPVVLGDEGLLRVALGHLVSNAVEATGAESARPPTVSAWTEGDEAQLSVRDWGRGMPTTDPNLLIRLLRSTKPGHAGLGLVTVERIVRLHGGTLRFACPGDGTQVTLTLPGARRS
jgi:two-component system, sporulation sensor kinase E